MSTSRGAPVADDLAVEADEVRQVGGDAVEVVGGEHDRQPVGVQVVEQVQDLVAGAHVDAGRRLVQQQQVGLAEQRAGDEHALLLAAGQLADVAVGQVADAEPVEHLVRPRPARRGSRHGRRRPSVRAISTHSPTVTGKLQLTVSTCGHVADAQARRGA